MTLTFRAEHRSKNPHINNNKKLYKAIKSLVFGFLNYKQTYICSEYIIFLGCAYMKKK